jgi:hypothetical protein
MKAVTCIEDYCRNELPSLDAIRAYFHPSYGNWTGEGSIVIYGAEGTENEPPGNGRLDLWLTIQQAPQMSFYLTHSQVGVKDHATYHSVGDDSLIYDEGHLQIIDDNGYKISQGLLVSADFAWVVVSHFVETAGERSPVIRWISGEVLPDSAWKPC